MAIRVIDHYPEINAIDVPRNASVKVVFNKGVIPQSITDSSFSVNDALTYSTHPGTIGVEYTESGVCNTAVFQPLINFTVNKKYKVYVFNERNSVVSVDNERLLTAYTFEFTAGTGILADPFPEGIPSGDLPLSGMEYSEDVTESVTAIETYTIITTDPQNMEPNIETQLSGVTITFSGNISSSLAELSGLITVEETPVLY